MSLGKKCPIFFSVAHKKGTQIVSDVSAELVEKRKTQSVPQGHQQVYKCHDLDRDFFSVLFLFKTKPKPQTLGPLPELEGQN